MMALAAVVLGTAVLALAAMELVALVVAVVELAG